MRKFAERNFMGSITAKEELVMSGIVCCDECSPEYINGKPSCSCSCHRDGSEH